MGRETQRRPDGRTHIMNKLNVTSSANLKVLGEGELSRVVGGFRHGSGNHPWKNQSKNGGGHKNSGGGSSMRQVSGGNSGTAVSLPGGITVFVGAGGNATFNVFN